MLLFTFGWTHPSFGSMANRVVVLNPWRVVRIFASAGSISSERYSSSPDTSTTCLPTPTPFASFGGSSVTHGSAASSGAASSSRASSERDMRGSGEGKQAAECRVCGRQGVGEPSGVSRRVPGTARVSGLGVHPAG